MDFEKEKITTASVQTNESSKSRNKMVWKIVKQCDSYLDYIIEENWSYHKTVETKSGYKEYYRCNTDVDKACKTGMCILFQADTNSVTFLNNDNEHIHVNIRSASFWGMDKNIKDRIVELY